MDAPQRFLLPRSRRLSCDVVRQSSKVPLCAHDRVCDFSELRALRSQLTERVSWPVLFIKAFALVARERPVLRQLFYRWPLRHVYQHPYSVAAMPIHREVDDEPWLFWAMFTNPESTGLRVSQQHLDRLGRAPIEQAFRQQYFLSAFPTFLRRMVLWVLLNTRGAKRVRRTGTFFLSTLSGMGAEIQSPPSFCTCNLTYGPIDSDGRCRVTIAYDHRMMDGVLVAKTLQQLEETLNGVVADEIRSLIDEEHAERHVRRPAA